MANVASVLLKLLKHTSASRLEVMLDPVELLGLLDSFGYETEEIEAAFKRGTKPGELLLQLFEEHGAETVWDALPPRAQSRAEQGEKEFKRKTTVRGQLEDVGLHRGRIAGAVVALTGSVWAAMYVLGATPDWGRGMTIGSAAFAVVCGVLGGAWSTRDANSSAGAWGGLACASLTLTIATIAGSYLDDPPGRWIVLAVVMPGALVGMGVTSWVLKRGTKEVQSF